MKIFQAGILVSGLLLSACVDQEFYLKNSVTYDRYQRDNTTCINDATAKAPASNQVTWAPYVGIYTIDANAPLRQANVDICMRDKGYQKLPVPACSGKALEAARTEGFGARSRLRQKLNITSESCWVFWNGETLIYTPKPQQ